MRVRLMLDTMRDGSAQTRYVPVGPVIVPRSLRPWASAIVGQPVAGVTRLTVGVGVGEGAGVGAGLLMMLMLPPVPGEAMSFAPQPPSAAIDTVAINMRRRFELVMFPVSSSLSRLVGGFDQTMQSRVGSPPRILIEGRSRKGM